MTPFFMLAFVSTLMHCQAFGADRLNQDPVDKLTVPIFRETSRDYLSPVFYQQGSVRSQSRHRRQLYNPFSNPYLEQQQSWRSTPRPWIVFGDSNAFLRRRHRGGGGFPRRNRNGNRRPIFVRPIRGGHFGGHRGGPHGGRGRGGGGRGGGPKG